MSKTLALLGLGFLTCVAPTLSANACKGDKILFDDDFSYHDRSWGAASEAFEIKDGKATLKPKSNQSFWGWNPAFAFDDADVCVAVTLVQSSDETRSGAGIMFWTKDNANFFTFIVASNGFYMVRRQLAGAWVADTIPWTQTDAIKQGPNQANLLRVTTKGQVVTLMLNDKEVARFKAQRPEGHVFVGFYATSPPDNPAIWQFSGLKITNVK